MAKSRFSEADKQLFFRLFTYTKPYRLRLFIGIFAGLVFGGGTVSLLPVMEKLTRNLTQMSEVSFRQFLSVLLLLPVLMGVRGIGFFISKYFVQWAGMQVVRDLRDRLFRHVSDLPMNYFSQSRTGELITRITSDTAMVQEAVAEALGDLIRNPPVIVSCLAYIFWLDWKFALISMVCFPLFIVPVKMLGKKVRKASKEGQVLAGSMTSKVHEVLYGMPVVKSFCMERTECEEFEGVTIRIFRRMMRITRAKAMMEPLMQFSSTVAGMLVLTVAYYQNVPIEHLLTFIAGLFLVYKPFRDLSKVYMRLQRTLPSAERIFELLDTPNTIQDLPAAAPLEKIPGQIEFRNVSFAYDGQPVLRDINLNVRSGECIALVGSSGAGKTTLVNLLPRFYDPTAGEILFDGKSIQGSTLQSLRSMIGVVTQKTILFNMTVAENISYGMEGATLEEIEAAARRANAHEFIMEMDDGYETVIGEYGTRVSGGQAQRLSIARALLKNPPILILDEATSALDTESERLVQKALDELMENRTVFAIAHRLSTIMHADRICVLDKGRIVESGRHDELLEQGGLYRYFYDIQFKEHGEKQTAGPASVRVPEK